MTKVFNRYSQKGLRNNLRNNLTYPEVVLWSKLKNRQVNNRKFRRQHGVGKYVVDFFCPELMLIIEIDGANHFFDAKSTVYDMERQKYLEAQNIKVLRFTNTAILDNLSEVLDIIYQEASNRSANPL